MLDLDKNFKVHQMIFLIANLGFRKTIDPVLNLFMHKNYVTIDCATSFPIMAIFKVANQGVYSSPKYWIIHLFTMFEYETSAL